MQPLDAEALPKWEKTLRVLARVKQGIADVVAAYGEGRAVLYAMQRG